MKAILFAAAAAITMAISATAIAQDSGKHLPSFEELDVHHDGLLTRSEIPKELQALREHFQLYDQNHDHRIDKIEYEAYLSSVSSDTSDCTGEARKGSSECIRGVNNRANLHQDHAPPPMMFAK
jgi:Ca2+-binding EF-hand superfamily protein